MRDGWRNALELERPRPSLTSGAFAIAAKTLSCRQSKTGRWAHACANGWSRSPRATRPIRTTGLTLFKSKERKTNQGGKMAAYIIVEVEVGDPVRYEDYKAMVPHRSKPTTVVSSCAAGGPKRSKA